MICKTCGCETEDGKFCAVCGAAMEAPVAAKDPGKVLGLISLILGILGFTPIGSTVMSVAAIILGVIGGKKSAEAGFENKQANIGKILGIISVILGALAIVGVIAFYIIYFVLIMGLGVMAM